MQYFNRQINVKFSIFGVLLFLTIVSATILSSSISSADTEKQSDTTVTVGSACTMFRESTVPHVVSVGPGSYREDVGTTRLKTVCNDTNGYAIYAIGYSNDTDGDTNMYGEEHGLTIPTGTASGDVSNWSMKLAKDLNSYNPENLTISAGFENYHDIPSFQAKVASFEGATDTTDGSVVTTTYAIRVSSTQLADTYTGQVRYTMVHPSNGIVPTGPEPEILYMQDVATWENRLSIGDSLIAVDRRDGKEYWVTKIETDPDIPDGRADCVGSGTKRICTQLWMTQNLDLELDANTITFTHDDTDLGWSNNDVNVVWTPQVATATTVDQFTDTITEERSFNLGDDVYYYNSGSTLPDSIYTLAECISAGNTENDCKHYHSGNLYNYYATAALGATSNGNPVSVGTRQFSEMPNSICPAGWRLPTGVTASSGGYSDYDYLFYRNSVTAAHADQNKSASYATHIYGDDDTVTDGFNNIRIQPLWFVRSGIVGRNDLGLQAGHGSYWSSTIASSEGAYRFAFTSGSKNMKPGEWQGGYYGNSVRCIARANTPIPEKDSGSEPTRLYIQDVTIDTCPTTTTVAYDKRDEQPYTIKKINGDCWMTTNLNLAGGTQLTPELSNVVTSYTLEQSSNENFSSYENENVYNTDNTDCSNNQPCYSYYSLKAALAGALDYGEPATQDICPKGWKIPNADKANEFRSAFINNMSDFNSSEWNPTHSGYYYRESVYNTNQFGYYWTSTNLGPQSATRLRMGYDVYNNTGWTDIAVFNDNNSDGLAARCIAKEQEPEPEPLPVNIQEITPDICPTTPTTFIDERDGNEYTIQKLADGNCWMLDNLRLDLTTVPLKKLKGKTNASDKTLEYLMGIRPGTEDDQYATNGVSTTWTFNETFRGSYSDPTINKDYINTLQSYGDGETKTGIYYNFCAASAGSYCYGNGSAPGTPVANAEEDICPAGWRLPTGSTNGDYKKLYAAYNNNGVDFKNALRASLTGYYDGISNVDAGSNGHIWSSSGYEYKYAYILYIITSSMVNPDAGTNRYDGGVVRCVAKDPIPQNMLSIGKDNCPTSPTKVYDPRDDEVYTIQQLADGNCWMLENLRLDSAALKVPLSTSDTNMSPYTSFSLPQSISSGFSNMATPQINTSSKNKEVANGSGNGTGKVGVYYNYCAASAGTYCTTSGSSTTISYDICPKGWRLPTGGSSGEPQALLTAYNGDHSAFGNAFYNTLSGYYADSSSGNQGGDAAIWTSNTYSTTAALTAYYTAELLPNIYFNRRFGLSIRCVAKNGTGESQSVTPEPEKLYMQDITDETCPADRTLVYDKRDDKPYYIQKLTANGLTRCWMTTNLDLEGGTTLDASTSNVADKTIYTLPESSLAGFLGEGNESVYNSHSTDCGSSSPCYSYYSFAVATANSFPLKDRSASFSGHAQYDICPRGWRLPKTDEFQALNTRYSSSLRFSPFYGVLGGWMSHDTYDHDGDNALFRSGGSFAWYWTGYASRDSMSNAFSQHSYFNTSRAGMAGGSTAVGVPIRCVAKTSDEGNIVPGLPSIQNITPSTCPAEPTSVFDSRDGSVYTIQKLEDGNCWMLENLRLGRSTVKVLSPGDTNIRSEFSLPGSVSTGFDEFEVPQINIDSKNDTTSYGDGENKIGVYYNYCAATAGTFCYPQNSSKGRPTQDICPKGWRLPTGGDEGEYQNLLNSYDTYADFKNALHASVSGYFKYSSNNHQGSYGSYWTNTPIGDDRIYSLDVRLNGVPNDFSSYRTAGLSIRCVAYESRDILIQEVTPETCPTTPTTVIDSRDNNTYLIQKLADGNCWMLDNLKLGRSTVKVLTPDDTNIKTNFTLPGGVSTGFDEFSLPQINIDSKNKITSYGDGENNIGVYYNYCAASAGTYCQPEGQSSGSPTSDVCPKGWRMPTGGEDGEYQNLYAQYNSYADFKNALHASLSGYFKYAQNNHQGSYGSFWSTTPVGDDRMYSLDVRATSVLGDFSSYRTAGLTIRCIAKEPEPDKIYMQDVTTASCPTERTLAYDKRDEKAYYIQKITTGNTTLCWMTSNLDLAGGTELYSDTSNVPDGFPSDGEGPFYILPPSSSVGFDDNSAAFVYNSNRTTCDGSQPCYSYYSFVAASAGTSMASGYVSYDICPKGWRLPYDYEFSVLNTEYSTINLITGAPWYGSLSGYNNGGDYRNYSDGYYWSSAVTNNYNSYYYYMGNNNMTVSNTPKKYGLSVRCVTK